MIRQSRISGPRDMGPLGALDPRDHGWREDLADIALADRIAVPNYARPVVLTVMADVIALSSAADSQSSAASQLLHGEGFAVLDDFNGWAWGYGLHDGYVGHVPLSALAPASLVGDLHMAGPGDALLLAEPAVKAAAVAVLPMGSQLRTSIHDDRFAVVAAGPHAGRFVHRRHLLPAAGDKGLDWVTLAGQFVGAPYRWGGRCRAGIDCSGLIQMARMVAGRRTRRDSDMQAADGIAVESAGQRGDIACWPGHIGVLLAPDMLLHANAHWMACVVEPLADVAARAGAEPVLRRFADD